MRKHSRSSDGYMPGIPKKTPPQEAGFSLIHHQAHAGTFGGLGKVQQCKGGRPFSSSGHR